jgi:hypothetical protein
VQRRRENKHGGVGPPPPHPAPAGCLRIHATKEDATTMARVRCTLPFPRFPGHVRSQLPLARSLAGWGRGKPPAVVVDDADANTHHTQLLLPRDTAVVDAIGYVHGASPLAAGSSEDDAPGAQSRREPGVYIPVVFCSKSLPRRRRGSSGENIFTCRSEATESPIFPCCWPCCGRSIWPELSGRAGTSQRNRRAQWSSCVPAGPSSSTVRV